ncbi:MAG: CotH kinase family protein [Prevotella sp.]|nr:CotH kinase family protein [Prevotella sp.]MBR2228659.1 CotH kinase family protein [Prevotella sp.]MBR6842976.1 CotH kinase family protein [Prevotella sp.]
MKRFALVVLVLACLVSCKTDLTGIENRITEVENQGQALDSRTKQLIDESQRLSAEIKELQKKSDELERESGELEKESQELKKELEDLKTKSMELAAELLALQEKGKALSGSFDDLNAKNELLVEEWNTLQELIDQSQEALDQLSAKINQTEPKLLHMEFLASENPLQLVENAECEIIGDSAVECRVLNLMSAKTLIPRIRFVGDYVTIGGQKVENSKTAFDFSSERILVVHSGEQIKEYTVTVSAYTGLPTLWAETNARTLSEANQYYKATISLQNNAGYGGKGGLPETAGRIMAQGFLRYYEKMIDWSGDIEWGKNDYKLNFTNAVSLLNMPSHTDWKLIPNVYDITMLHNQTALFMSEISTLDYTPRFHYVDMMFNGRYSGTYMLGETLSAGISRVNVGDDGFILSISSTTSGSVFTTAHLEQPVSILYPSSHTASVVNYITNVVRDAEAVLFSSNFTDEFTGWQQYMDINSFVEWYVINEIAKNPRGAFWTNCIMNYRRAGKLKMGPIWDFETAFGDAGNSGPTGFIIKDVSWYSRLFQDPVFVARVKKRFDYFYNHREEIVKSINENAQYLKYAIQEDNTKWDTFEKYQSSGVDVWTLYQGQVASMKDWFIERMEWLKEQFDAM